VRFDVKTTGLPVLALALMAPALAQTPPTKIAIINIQGAILATKDGEAARTQISTKFGPKAKDMEARMQTINQKRETLSKGANTMSEAQRGALGKEIEDLQKKYQWDSEDIQSELQQEEQKYVGEIGQRMIQIIDEYAKAQNFAVVLDVSGQQSPVLWAAAGVDITQPIVQQYDAKFGNKAAAPGAAAAPGGSAAPVTSPVKPATPTTKPASPPAVPPKKP
jgi:outer membrane protein